MYLIKNAHVYAPEDLGIVDVLIGGGKILKMAEELPEEKSYGVEVIDGKGKILIPGLIDAHVHILGGGGEGGAKTRTPEIMLSDITTGGVTTVVGCLGTDGCTRTMTNLLAKAKGLEEEGITTFVYTGSYQVPVRTLTGSIMDDLILLEKVVGTGEIAISDHPGGFLKDRCRYQSGRYPVCKSRTCKYPHGRRRGEASLSQNPSGKQPDPADQYASDPYQS